MMGRWLVGLVRWTEVGWADQVDGESADCDADMCADDELYFPDVGEAVGGVI